MYFCLCGMPRSVLHRSGTIKPNGTCLSDVAPPQTSNSPRKHTEKHGIFLNHVGIFRVIPCVSVAINLELGLGKRHWPQALLFLRLRHCGTGVKVTAMSATELLAPAGTLNNLRYAIAYGADAVYAGIPRYSLRVRNNDFHRLENLAQGIREVHDAGRAFYLASNILPHEAKIKTFIRDMEPVIELGPDALIMADPGLILMVRERWPDMPVHLSVQANTMNHASVRFWQAQGISRIILSRELSLEQIEEIRQQCPDMELEVFVHGALCIAYSGRCLLSGYFNHRDANQGTCTNSCRSDYKLHDASEDSSGCLLYTSDAADERG